MLICGWQKINILALVRVKIYNLAAFMLEINILTSSNLPIELLTSVIWSLLESCLIYKQEPHLFIYHDLIKNIHLVVKIFKTAFL